MRGDRGRDKEIETREEGPGGRGVALPVLSSAPLLQSPRQHACRAPVRCIITDAPRERETVSATGRREGEDEGDGWGGGA